jgi:acetylornithine deacetylase
MGLTSLEHVLIDAIQARRDDLVELAARLIAFDTTARDVGDPPRDEAELQQVLAARLMGAGACVELWEPSASDLQGAPICPPGLDFTGRPQMIARFAGHGDGPSLLFNGHIDAVSAEPVCQWTSDPFRAEVRGGRLYGRGACDMKCGVAAMTVAAEVLAEHADLAGDLIVCTNTDEESSGAGSMALVNHGVRADAGIIPEPTGFDTWIAGRGSSFLTIDVPGRPGHGEIDQPAWREGGAVNAIEKATILIDEIKRLRDDWRARPEQQHTLLPPGSVVPTMLTAGEWGASYPASCRILCVVPYVPAQADAGGWVSDVRREVDERLVQVAATDDWLAEHPPIMSWSANVMPLELSADEPTVTVVSRASADIGRPGQLAGLNSWFDGATFSCLAATPTVAYGPSGRDGSRTLLHAVDEYVPIDDLVACAQGLAVAALRFCGLPWKDAKLLEAFEIGRGSSARDPRAT